MDGTSSTIDNKRQRNSKDHLISNPIFWSFIGVIQTLFTAGIVFGWASLLSVLRDEGVDYAPEEFSRIFTCGAVGNYVSTLAFGLVLDHYGPRWTAIVASFLFSIGCILCHYHDSYNCLLIGFGLLGFSGPGIQMPTLHLANLFTSTSDDDTTSSGGGAIYMSSQAAAFDGGTAIFALVRFAYQRYEIKTSTFFIFYLIIPFGVLLTAWFVWPDEVITNPSTSSSSSSSQNANTPVERSSSNSSPYFGPGSPYLTPKLKRLQLQQQQQQQIKKDTASLYDAPLGVVLKHSSFWMLALWVSIHILKLNFVVATINDQLNDAVSMDEAQSLIGTFGAMLPFGFVILPVIAWLLQKSTSWAFQLTNIFGLIYGLILVYFASISWLLKWIVFPVIATSRQMVYSTIFHQIGVTFGFVNYGVLLGLTNILVSAFSMIQNPLVTWSESLGDYKSANTVLLLMTLPLFAAGFVVSDPESSRQNSQKSISQHKSVSEQEAGEETPLLRMQSKDRSSSF